MKIFNLTEEEEEKIGEQLAAIFDLELDKRKTKLWGKKVWKLGGGYIDKTNIGLTKTFIGIIDKINADEDLSL